MTYVKPFFCLGIASLLLVSACAHGMKPSLTFLSLSLSRFLFLFSMKLHDALFFFRFHPIWIRRSKWTR